MARIALIGGHGKVALLAEPLLADAGHQVTAFVRNPDHAADVRAASATPQVADIETLGVDGLTELLRGFDIVVWSAGAGGGSPERTYAVDRDAAIRSMDAAVAAGVRRYIMVSYFGAGPDHGVPEGDSFFAYADAKAAADTHLRSTDLDWTILMPSRLTLEPARGIDLDPADKGSVSREAVAQVIAAVVDAPATVGKDLPFNDGDTPVAQALASLGA
ncbi:NAD(P)H-binding protein [Calidifontibacter sp. DB0510]|uniref:NAD(P)H-binding protein n=1 Tax=Metallococcus carri TaxID=1656884 RepID=A0A967B1P3_9MICO|nr:NAD(P)H-binding protein [Metallococcus carri]NHN55873.1 NAD(P)H-binding protein [Metallococcus carri]NOP38439.1 NAD(P)H-binding protein [Calidifontibacter sp. DB2511S]